MTDAVVAVEAFGLVFSDIGGAAGFVAAVLDFALEDECYRSA